jgi:excinuclease ABC subunit C
MLTANHEPRDMKIAALAKREEELFISNFQFPNANLKSEIRNLKLPRTSAALKLLQYVRDESHRFAQHYHHLLRDKNLLDQ